MSKFPSKFGIIVPVKWLTQASVWSEWQSHYRSCQVYHLPLYDSAPKKFFSSNYLQEFTFDNVMPPSHGVQFYIAAFVLLVFSIASVCFRDSRVFDQTYEILRPWEGDSWEYGRINNKDALSTANYGMNQNTT